MEVEIKIKLKLCFFFGVFSVPHKLKSKKRRAN